MKLSTDLLENSCSFMNALQDWELDLRDNKIPAIENFAITRDQYDTVDLTNNEIRILDNFPPLRRLKSLLLSHNRIEKIDADLAMNLTSLRVLILSNNSIKELGDLEGIFGCQKLEYLSLMDNPVTGKEFYRLYVIHRLPKLKSLDFQRIALKEREESNAMFSSDKGKQIVSDIKKSVPTSISELSALKKVVKESKGLSADEIKRIQDKIAKAGSLDEVARLERLLKTGHVPK